jgi:hypothetical protein
MSLPLRMNLSLHPFGWRLKFILNGTERLAVVEGKIEIIFNYLFRVCHFLAQ